MSILDTITTLNQEASVRASSVTERGRKGQASDDPMQQMEEGELDMSVDECDSPLDGKLSEDTEEAKLATGVEALEVRTEDQQEEMDLEKEELTEEVKMEAEDSGAQGKTEEEKDKPVSKIAGKQTEEKLEDDQLKSTSQAKQKARERIKEGELLCPLCFSAWNEKEQKSQT